MKTTVLSALIHDVSVPAFTQIARVLGRFDDALLERVADAGVRIRALSAGEKYADVSPTISELNVPVDAWPMPPAGLFVVDERCVYLRSLSDMTIAHEFGHAIDCALGGGRYLSEVNVDIQHSFRSATAFVTPYAASRIDEYFAEAIRAYVGANDPTSPWPRVSRERLAFVDPAMHAIIDRLLCLRE